MEGHPCLRRRSAAEGGVLVAEEIEAVAKLDERLLESGVALEQLANLVVLAFVGRKLALFRTIAVGAEDYIKVSAAKPEDGDPGGHHQRSFTLGGHHRRRNEARELSRVRDEPERTKLRAMYRLTTSGRRSVTHVQFSVW